MGGAPHDWRVPIGMPPVSEFCFVANEGMLCSDPGQNESLLKHTTPPTIVPSSTDLDENASRKTRLQYYCSQVREKQQARSHVDSHFDN